MFFPTICQESIWLAGWMSFAIGVLVTVGALSLAMLTLGRRG